MCNSPTVTHTHALCLYLPNKSPPLTVTLQKNIRTSAPLTHNSRYNTHMNTTAQLTFLSTSVADTLSLGHAIGALLHRGDLVLLAGDLGAGKTHMSKGIVAGTGSTDLVTSPTFVFINEYRAPNQLTVFHVDLYRIESATEIDSIGLADATAGSGICLIEWAERDPSLAEIPHLQLMLFHHNQTSRLIQLSSVGPRATALLHTLQQQPPLTIYRGDSV